MYVAANDDRRQTDTDRLKLRPSNDERDLSLLSSFRPNAARILCTREILARFPAMDCKFPQGFSTPFRLNSRRIFRLVPIKYMALVPASHRLETILVGSNFGRRRIIDTISVVQSLGTSLIFYPCRRPK